MKLQNRDGGIPTFCKGWKDMAFDRSGADLTAHAIRALSVWQNDFDSVFQKRIDQFLSKALGYLSDNQREDGSWAPLWFGNQYAPDDENATYGTARVVRALGNVSAHFTTAIAPMMKKGVEWLMRGQNTDGGWGGSGKGESPSSIEETAMALGAIARMLPAGKSNSAATDKDAATNQKGLIEELPIDALCESVTRG